MEEGLNNFMKSNKNVLYIGGFELPDKNAAAHRVLSNGKILNKLNYKVTYLGISHDKTCNSDIIATQEITDTGIAYKKKYPKNKFEWFHYLSDVSYIIKLIEIHDIKNIIAYNFPALTLYKLKKYCTKRNIGIYSDCTEWYLPEGSIIFKLIKGLDSFCRMRIIHVKLDGIIVISKYLFNYYYKKNLNTILIPPLVDLNEAKWNSNINRIDSNIIELIYAGSPGGKRKDHLGKTIISLGNIKQNTNIDFHFDIVGVTKSEYEKLWDKFPIPQILEGSIKFSGRITNNQVIQKLMAADFSIFIREDNLITKAGFPTKLVESISAGTPVITNKSSNIEDFLKEGINGFFLDIKTIGSLEKSLERALRSSRNTINCMKLACKEETTFDYMNYLSEFKSFLRF